MDELAFLERQKEKDRLIVQIREFFVTVIVGFATGLIYHFVFPEANIKAAAALTALPPWVGHTDLKFCYGLPPEEVSLFHR